MILMIMIDINRFCSTAFGTGFETGCGYSCRGCSLLVLWIISGRSQKPNRTGRTELNRSVWFWNPPELDAETNRTEHRATTRPRNAGRTASNRENYISEPTRTEPINFRKVPNRNESNRTGSLLPWRRRPSPGPRRRPRHRSSPNIIKQCHDYHYYYYHYHYYYHYYNIQ